MKDFLFLYRGPELKEQPSPEQMQESMNSWMNWLGNIGAQNKLVDQGSSLQADGKVVRTDGVITDGPFTEVKEVIGGYSIIKANDLAEAAEIAKGCPIFQAGGNVEVREINVL